MCSIHLHNSLNMEKRSFQSIVLLLFRVRIEMLCVKAYWHILVKVIFTLGFCALVFSVLSKEPEYCVFYNLIININLLGNNYISLLAFAHGTKAAGSASTFDFVWANCGELAG